MPVPKVFRRTSDDGHATVFKSRIVADMIALEFERPKELGGGRLLTTLNKSDARRYAEWLMEKTK